MTDSDRDEWIAPGEAARRFGVSTRSIERAARAGKVRTRNNPRRRGKLYHVGDLERWGGAELLQPEPELASAELVPLSDMLEALNRKDDQLAEANTQLQRAALEIGSLRAQLESQQKLLESSETRQQAAESEAERLRRIIRRMPWWLRMIWARDT